MNEISITGIPERLVDKDWKIALIIGALCLTAYFPALNNGFIGDDYVLLERTREIREDPLFLLRISPDTFRATTYFAFGILKALFGFNAVPFYVFTILLHFANTLLLHRLLLRVTGCPGTAILGAVFFAVFQNPQEAVMWLSAMNEALLGFFVLATLLLWSQGRYAAAGLTYLVALFSKESALMVLGLVPLVETCVRGRFRFRWVLGYLLVPTLVFAGIFVHSMPQNSLINQGIYTIGWRAVRVLATTLHRLMFPWLYLAAAMFFLLQRRKILLVAWTPAAWVTVALAPYLFLTYQNHVPSRHEYMASMGLAWGVAVLIIRWRQPRFSGAFLLIFLVVNISYLWAVKDRAYIRRAAPTTLLIRELREYPPGCLQLDGFPYNPWAAKMTTRVVPGWQPGMITVGQLPGPCDNCRRLKWDSNTERYRQF